MIEIDGITKSYDGNVVVNDVSMTIEPRTVTVIVGTSGSGKTTLLRMINRLVEPTAGTIRLDGEDNRSMPGFELRRPDRLCDPGPRAVSASYCRAEHCDGAGSAWLGQGADRCEGRGVADACFSSIRQPLHPGFRMSFPAASSNASAWRGRSRQSRTCC